VAASRLFVQSYIIHVFPVFLTLSVFILVLVDALLCAVSDCVITLSFIGWSIYRVFIAKSLVVSTSVLAAAAMFSQAVSPIGYAYSRDC